MLKFMKRLLVYPLLMLLVFIRSLLWLFAGDIGPSDKLDNLEQSIGTLMDSLQEWAM